MTADVVPFDERNLKTFLLWPFTCGQVGCENRREWPEEASTFPLELLSLHHLSFACFEDAGNVCRVLNATNVPCTLSRIVLTEGICNTNYGTRRLLPDELLLLSEGSWVAALFGDALIRIVELAVDRELWEEPQSMA